METIFTLEFLLRILTAVGLGALFGVPKIQKKDHKPHQSELSGIRTYSIISLLGFVSAVLADKTGFLVFGIIFLMTGVLIASAYGQEARKYGFIGITSEILSLLIFLIGAMVFWDQKIAVIIAVIAVMISAFKKSLRDFSKNISPEELKALLKFIIVAFIVLPLLPREAIDPWGVIVPYKAWLMVIFISGISFLGYILTKIVGTHRGIELTGLVGGLASSTATTSSMASGSKKNTHIVHPFVFAVIAASSIMFARILFTVFVINVSLFYKLLFPLLAIMVVCAGVLISLYRREKHHGEVSKEPLNLQSPFQLKPALLFAGLYIVILLLAHFMYEFFGQKGLFVASALAGITDVDAITLTLSQLHSTQTITDIVATQGIILAALVNTSVKLFLARLFGGKDFARVTTKAFLVILLGGVLTLGGMYWGVVF